MPITRVTSLPVAVVVCLAGFSAQADAQVPPPIAALAQVAAAHGELQGVVTDDRGEPLPGAVVSALGSTTAFAITDRAGRFAFRTLPPGPYLIRAHLKGYVPPRARMIQVNSAARATSAIALARRPGPDDPPQFLAAGVGVTPEPASDPDDAGDHDHSERAWRLRHLKRSVLKDVEAAIVAVEDEGSFLEDSFETLGRAMGYPARAASSLFTDLPPLSGEVNFLTTRSFDQPQDLFSVHGVPRGVAFVSLTAPTAAGDWNIRGAMTQGDIASWVVSGSYARRSAGAHQYEAGMLYSMQRYEGGNPAALVAITDGSRNAGEVFAYDRWTVRRGVTLHYGARYARYDYLQDDALFSPRIGIILGPSEGVRLRVTASRRELAPGAEEFVPQGALGVWLPPERTFSPLSTWRGFRAERVEHYEVATEHDMPGGFMMGLRAFRQTVNDQMVTLFGVSSPTRVAADIGHYYVASGGDLSARGFGLSVSRQIRGNVRGSLDYTLVNADWRGESPDSRGLLMIAPSARRTESEVVHDLTTSLQTNIPVTATRFYVLYKVNSGFAAPEVIERAGGRGARFDVQINQALPFLDFTAANWEMLLTVRNLFHEELVDASVYDELLVVKPPKRIVGGLTVRF
jgi:outer membrane receptor protein involved in Fe transport